MQLTEQECSAVVDSWMGRFNAAIAQGPGLEAQRNLNDLFHRQSYWRDALALTWNLQTLTTDGAISDELRSFMNNHALTDLRLDTNATPPRVVVRAGSEAVEAFFTFDTDLARCRGCVRLTPSADELGIWRAWNFFTAMDQLIGFEEKVNRNRPNGKSYSRDFRGPNWLDKRVAAVQYKERDPEVLVVGSGHAGLSAAARLTQLGVDTLIVDKNRSVGDNWRNRYHALTLHNQVHVNHLPYMPFPPTWPVYVPKDMVGMWLELYAAVMELNVWTESEVTSARYDRTAGRWNVDVSQADGKVRQVHPRHMIMATGVSGIPRLPHLDALDAFEGSVLHSSEYHDGEDWSAKKAIVIGTGNSGHDIAQDLYSSGATVTMVQRGPSLIVDLEPSAQFPYTLYSENRTTDECDFITASMPLPLVKKAHQSFTRQAREADQALLEGLTKIGFRLDFGEDDTGWQFKYLTRGGGYYFNVGCSDLLVERKIGLVQFDEIDTFRAAGMLMKDGSSIDADIVVLATGYEPQEYLVRKLFGDEIAEQTGPIWGYDERLELRNMYCQTGHPGLWFIAGSFAQCRIYSKYLALQIKAIEQGLIAGGTVG